MPEQDIINCLNEFQFYRNKSGDKFESLALTCRNSMDVVSHHEISGKLFFPFRKLTFTEAQLNVLLLISVHLTLTLVYCK